MAVLRRTIALVGMMGAGKSSVGRRLAVAWTCLFATPTPKSRPQRAATVSDIFERYGESAFRDGERKVIGRLLAEPPHVMATGGGAFIDPRRVRI